MTHTLETEAHFQASADAMLQLMSDPELLRGQQLLQGALQASVEALSRDERQLRQRIALREPHRSLGGADPSTVVEAVVEYSWDLVGRGCTWSYRGERGEWVQIDGRIEVLPDGEGCRVRSKVTVRVPVPVLGPVLERRIAKEIEAGFAPYERYLREALAGRKR